MKRLLVVALLFAACQDYSDGDRVGVVTKFSRKGIVCKTFEGELVMGGTRLQRNGEGPSTLAANVWAFTVDSKEKAIIETIQNSMENGARVKLRYTQSLFAPCASETGYFVTGITILE